MWLLSQLAFQGLTQDGLAATGSGAVWKTAGKWVTICSKPAIIFTKTPARTCSHHGRLTLRPIVSKVLSTRKGRRDLCACTPWSSKVFACITKYNIRVLWGGEWADESHCLHFAPCDACSHDCEGSGGWILSGLNGAKGQRSSWHGQPHLKYPGILNRLQGERGNWWHYSHRLCR